MQRTIFLSLALAGSVLAQTGTAVPELVELDRAALAFLEQSKIPGIALAVVKDNRLIYARGFGWADEELKSPVMPDTLMRIGSISKPLTAVAVLKLVDQGKLNLDQPIVPLLGRKILDPATIADPRWNRITVRNLLNHSGGWDADSTFDPLFPPPEILADFGISLPLRKPLSIDFLIQAMAKLPLQFEPGTKYSYSNFGFAILSRIVEIASGVSYQRFVQREVLEPIGIQRMQLASGKRSGRLLGEASYYDSPDSPLLPAAYPDTPDPVAAPDGGFYMEIIQGAGAWVASAIDLVRFAVAIDGGLPDQLLLPSTRRLWTSPPAFASNPNSYYALGVGVEKNAGVIEWWHNGAINGSESYLQGSTAAGVRLALIVNGWPSQENADAVGQALTEFAGALGRVTHWPQTNQFDAFYSSGGGGPRFATNGVAITAGFVPGKAVPGALATLFGNNLAGEGLRVTLDGLSAPIISSNRNQVTVVAPLALKSPSTVRAEIQRDGAPAVSASVEVVSAAPYLFTVSGNGQGPAVAVDENGSLNSERNPARAGSQVSIFVSGLGAQQKSMPVVLINDHSVDVIHSRALPAFLGQVAEVRFVTPSTAPGLAKVQVQADESSSRATVYLWTR